MNEEEILGKRILIMMFVGCLVLLAAVSICIAFYSPKTVVPNSSYSAEETETMSTSDTKIFSEDSVFPIDINSADSEELQLIPNIGPATAKLIIDYRKEYGTIVSFRELLSIDGIGEKTVEILKEYCIIN